jgi:hypothetical protein
MHLKHRFIFYDPPGSGKPEPPSPDASSGQALFKGRAGEGLAQIPVKSVCRTKIFLKSNIPTPIYGMVKHFDNISEA